MRPGACPIRTSTFATPCTTTFSAWGGYQALAFDGLVDNLAETVDRDSVREDVSQQLTMFPLEGDYKLGDGMRVGKRYAQRTHAEAALTLDDANLKAVEGANQRKHDEFNLLAPLWLPGMTKQEAVAAYREANPLEEAS